MHFVLMENEAKIANAQTQQSDAQWRSQKRPMKDHLSYQKSHLDWSLLGLVVIQFILLTLAYVQAISPMIAAISSVGIVVLYALATHLSWFAKRPFKEIETPSKKTQELSERLEMLEDQSWEIRESEDIHRSAAEAFGDIVIHRNSMGDITFSNSVFKKYFDHPSQLPEFEISAFDNNQVSIIRDLEIATKVGPRWFAWTDLVFRDFETGDSGTRSIGRDISERKQHEQLLETKANEAHQANDAKTRFLGMMSHEIRTPLSGILGMTKLLHDSNLTSTQFSHLNAIEKSSETLLELVEDLLDQAQLDTGHMVITKSPTNLVRLVEDVCELLSDHARQKNITIASHVDARIAHSVELDAARLKQVLVNLAGNALKFTETGGVSIDITLKNADQDNFPGLSVSIQDSGPGIPDQDIDKIFNAFAQVDSSSSRHHEGAGLGLAISQDIVRLMGGKISVQSTLDEGTVFQFELPLTQEELVQPESDKIDCVILAMPQTPARDAIVKTAYQFCRKVITANSVEKLDLIAATCPKGSVVIVDGAFSVSSKWTETIRETLSPSARIIRLEPARGTKNKDPENLFDGWLTWPIRSESLQNSLHNIHAPDADEMPLTEFHPETTELPINGPPLHVLLAEDNPINTLLATSLLGKLGHRVTHAEDGEKAYELFVRSQSVSPYDVVLMDLHMPQCDGTTSIRSIRKYESGMDLKRVPIIVLSADNQDHSKEDAFEAGADDFLLKPLDFENVANILNTMGMSETETISRATV